MEWSVIEWNRIDWHIISSTTSDLICGFGKALLPERICSLRGSKFFHVRVPSQTAGENNSQWNIESHTHFSPFHPRFKLCLLKIETKFFYVNHDVVCKSPYITLEASQIQYNICGQHLIYHNIRR